MSAEQLNGISKWQNFWSDIYDFTDAPDNWTFLPEVTAAGFLSFAAPAL